MADRIIIEDTAQVHRLKDVLRLQAKGRVNIFDEQGNEYECIIESMAKSAVLRIKERRPFREKPDKKVTLACAIPKKAKFDELVDKLTQLGVDKIIPMLTERVIVKWDKEKKVAQERRWEKIALSAAEQSQRNTLPVIAPVKNIKEVLREANNYDLKLIPHLTGRRKTLKEILAPAKAKNILILIGPEGDFTPEEVELAVKAGCIPVTLGDLVLRVDTAAIAITSFIKFYQGLSPQLVPEGEGTVPEHYNENS